VLNNADNADERGQR